MDEFMYNFKSLIGICLIAAAVLLGTPTMILAFLIGPIALLVGVIVIVLAAVVSATIAAQNIFPRI